MSNTTRTVGLDGREVVPVAYGTMSLCGAYGPAGDTPTRLKILDSLYEMGSGNWDSADRYGDTEDVIGEWFEANPEKRKDVFVATKCGLTPEMQVRSDPDYVLAACDRSLARLKTEYIDLYYIHRVDQKTPIEKTMDALSQLKKQGKIRAIGLSEVSARTLQRACKVEHVDALQTEYSPFCLDIEKLGILDACKSLKITIFAYGPLGRGFLTGSYTQEDFAKDLRGKSPRFMADAFERNMELVRTITKVTDSVKQRYPEITQAQVVLAWILRQWKGIVPLTGTRNVERAKLSLGARDVQLNGDEDDEIRAAAESLKDVGDRYHDEALMQMLNADTPDL